MITLGQIKSDIINQIITIANGFYLVTFRKWDYWTLITLSGFFFFLTLFSFIRRSWSSYMQNRYMPAYVSNKRRETCFLFFPISISFLGFNLAEQNKTSEYCNLLFVFWSKNYLQFTVTYTNSKRGENIPLGFMLYMSTNFELILKL